MEVVFRRVGLQLHSLGDSVTRDHHLFHCSNRHSLDWQARGGADDPVFDLVILLLIANAVVTRLVWRYRKIRKLIDGSISVLRADEMPAIAPQNSIRFLRKKSS